MTDVQDRLDRLESLVEAQQETIQEQRDRIAELEADETDRSGTDETDGDGTTAEPAVLNRRSALKAGGLLALVFGGVGTASADPQGQIGTDRDPLTAVHTEELNGGVTGDQALTDLTGAGLSIDGGALEASGASSWEEADSDGLLEPNSSFTGIDVTDVRTDNLNGSVTGSTDLTDLAGNGLTIGSGSLGIAAGGVDTAELANDSLTVAGNTVSLGGSTGIAHADLSGIGPSDHHTRPAAGIGLRESVDAFDIDLSAIAGENLSADTANGELDAASAAFADSDGDDLLEPTDASDGIDVTTVQVANLDDSGGSSHLTLDSGGPLALNQDLDTNGNDIQSDGSVSVDIDANGDGTGETFTVTRDGGTTALVTVNEGGKVDINSGNIDLDGNSLTDSSGVLTIEASTGNGATVTTDGSTRALRLGVPKGDSNGGTAGASVVAGNQNNGASGAGAAVLGGGSDAGSNTAGGDYATVAGGENNTATGNYSFAAGRNATAEFPGSFVWADSTGGSLTSVANDEFVARASGGVYLYSSSDTSTGVELFPGSGTWTAASTRTIKSNVDPVDEQSVLERVEELAVSTWSYDAQDEGVRHMGPMAEEFYAAFGLGADDEHIASVDADGVALAAIQGLSERLEERDERIDDLEAENDRLRDRLAAVEAELGIDATAGSQGVADD